MLSTSRSSSPDPIALSPTPTSGRQRTQTVNNTPLAQRSSNGRRLTSSKSIAFDTPASNGSSPWKIKVTVEAEPHSQDSDAENVSPLQNAKARSRSTKVPLKGADESTPSKSKSGRPAKTGSAAKGRRRNGTPIGRRRSKGQEDEYIPRTQSIRKSQSLKSTPASSQDGKKLTLSSMLDAGDSDASGDVLDIMPGSSTVNKGQEAPASTAKRPSPLHTIMLPKSVSSNLSTVPPSSNNPPKRIDSRVEQARADDPAENAYDEPETAYLYEEYDNLCEPDVAESAPGDETVLHSEGFSFVDLSSVRETLENEKQKKPELKRNKSRGQSSIQEDEYTSETGTKTPLDLSKNNVLLSEDLPNIPDFSSLAPTPIDRTIIKTEPRSNEKASGHPKASESESVSVIPSSPPVPVLRLPSPSQITPIRNVTSSFQTPAQETSCSRNNTPTLKLAKIVKTGIALQRVLQSRSPFDSKDIVTDKNKSRTGDSLNNLLCQFNERTRREIRAGLKFGGELAKQSNAFRRMDELPSESQVIDASLQALKKSHDQFHPFLTPEATDDSDGPNDLTPNDSVVYPTLPIITDSSSIMSSPDQSHVESLPCSPTTQPTLAGAENSDDLNQSQILELQWQQEREAVSRQIEVASASQVVIIDSDEEADDDDQDGLEQDDLEDDNLEEDDTEDEDASSAEEGDDTGFFFQRNLPAVFERSRKARCEGNIDFSMIPELKHKESSYNAGIANPLQGPLTQEAEENEKVIDDNSHARVDKALDSRSSLSEIAEDTRSDQSTDQNDEHPRHSQVAGHVVRDESSLSTIPESDEDMSQQDTDLWLPKSNPKSSTEHRTSQEEADAQTDETASLYNNSAYQMEPPSDGKPGLFSRLTSFFWSSLSWSTTFQPLHSPAATPQPQPQDTSRLQALQQKYGKLSRYEPWSLAHYRILNRMHYRNKLEPEYFRSFPHDRNTTTTRPSADAAGPQPPPRSHVLDTRLQGLVGHTIQNRGFTVTLSLADAYIVAAFLDLLVEPEMLSREELQAQTEQAPGDEGVEGAVIGIETVALRLFSLYAGDQMREEERLGLRPPY